MAKRRRNDEIDEAEANRSDSNDGDYDDREVRGSAKKSKTRSRHHPPTKRSKRSRRAGSDIVSDEDDDDLEDDEDSFVEESEEDEVEIDPKTGRPRRQRSKPNYGESSDEDEESPGDSDEDDRIEDDEIEDSEKEHLQKVAKSQPKRKIVRLKVTRKQQQEITRMADPTRARTASIEPLSAGTRRSSRFRGDLDEDIVALGPSGNVEVIVRSRTTTPEIQPRRQSTGRKGLKKPTTATIEEVSEESSVPNPPLPGDDIADSPVQSIEDDEDKAKDLGESDQEAAEAVDDAKPDGEAEEQEDKAEVEDEDDDDDDDQPLRGRTRSSRKKDENSQLKSKKRKRNDDDGSEFEAGEEDENDEMSDSEKSDRSPAKHLEVEEDDSGSNKRSGRLTRGGANKSRSRRDSPAVDEIEEIAEELEELTQGRRKRLRTAAPASYEPALRRRAKEVDYRVFRPDALAPLEEDENHVAPSPSRRPRGAASSSWQRTLFPTSGPFGGAGGVPSVFGGPGAIGAAGGVDSDSSDDERPQRPMGLNPGMTPTSTFPPGLLPSAQTHSTDPFQASAVGGTPANLGKIKDRQALADADPLGVDQNVSFDNVGGLGSHINQLQEMVALPLLYPEIFSRFHVTPPRGVLFHGPPGTGKTLLARALANSVSSHGRKVTFYMRKGADALSKWVGEAERQLRLLFDEARKTQPSIIFFDEIDGLAPVRSSKQEQIHASIVSTLLALMDGMDGRGQVIVIGATNRPDSVDPALRRPGRFDREFYFPLPSTEARRSILDIHTKGWQPGLSSEFKDELAEVTKGYGGADLRALCTEAALNAVQRSYPQIYKSKEKLVIDPSTINVTARDFMISVKKLVPSSERSASSGSAPLPKPMEPLLQSTLSDITASIGEIMPQTKPRTALEEAEYEDDADSATGFMKEKMQQDFEVFRVHRPRLLIHGKEGMGQQYLAAAILNHFEGFHVQSFDLATLMGDSTRSPEATVVQLFTEIKRHKPAVIFLPSFDVWADTIGQTVLSTFVGLLRSIPATDPILVLGIMEGELDDMDEGLIKAVFGITKASRLELPRPNTDSRQAYFEPLIGHIKKSPQEFPDPLNRKKRILQDLQVAPAPPPKPPSKQELAAVKKRDRQTLNLLKIRIQPIMDQIKLKYRIFRNPPIDINLHSYLYEDEDPDIVVSDIPDAVTKPFEKSKDKDGNFCLKEKATGKLLYNMDITTIEERLSNGYYTRPRDFFMDVNFLAKDARALEDRNKMIKANELVANVDVDIAMFENEPMFADCENMYRREMQRRLDLDKKAQKKRDSEISHERATAEARSRGLTQEQTAKEIESQQSDVPAPVLGIPVPSTPSRPSQQSSLSNGIRSGISNISHTADGGAFSHLSGSNLGDLPAIKEQTEGESQTAAGQQNSQHIWGMPPGHPTSQSAQTSFMGQSGTNTQRSQRGVLTSMQHGSQVDDYVNDASTTTSGKKTTQSGTNDSHRSSSGPQWNTQTSNGEVRTGHGVNNSSSLDSALPDTQEGPPSSQDSIAAVPAHTHRSSISAILNAPSTIGGGGNNQSGAAVPTTITTTIGGAIGTGTKTAAAPPPELIQANGTALEMFEKELVSRTSGCSVEQLQLINARLMAYIYKTRDKWNRSEVLLECADRLEETIDELGNEVGQSSSNSLRGAVEAVMEG